MRRDAREAALDADSLDLGALLRKQPLTLEQICARTGLRERDALRAIRAAQRAGVSITLIDRHYALALKDAPPAFVAGDLPVLKSDRNGVYRFGACGDNHLGSKYARLDVLNELYDIYAKEGIKTVYNTGNWIDGEASFNVHDLLVRGMEEQLDYLAEHYPRREGIVTHAVAGDDHEGWYAQKFGVDIGLRAEQTMRAAGRSDWRNLGYMEAHIRLRHARTGAESILAVVHPGGGSAYALSYTVQKIVESLEGGEKPAVGLYGHYHKLMVANIRNVWTIQTGTTQDQTPFMRKKRLAAHVGGCIVELRQDADTGAIVRCKVEMLRWFNRGFYNDRWSHARMPHPAGRALGIDD
ncbi:MAG: hypothetical protein QJR02_07110 [Sinobacteraceae bacterium]|nr:hypothetical protein [Nevskiaceae bacterium]